MKANHTPGPWSIFPGNYHASFVVPETDLSKRLGGADDKEEDLTDYAQEVCVIDRRHRHRSVEEQQANARLIAAAPELLTACLAMLSERSGPAQLSNACLDARDAIAKATGSPA